MRTYRPSDISAVVCTKNSASTISHCLVSLRECKVGEIIVVDGGSTDGTVEIARTIVDHIIFDTGTGLGAARALGIAKSTLPLILNFGSDNVMEPKCLDEMIKDLMTKDILGVSAVTEIRDDSYLGTSLNLYKACRFPSGYRSVIGTPTLLPGDQLRHNGFDPSCRFSDDADLCERWSAGQPNRFFISAAVVEEVGRATWLEVVRRWTIYGMSDFEVYSNGKASGWTLRRRIASLSYPLRNELVVPLRSSKWTMRLRLLPFLLTITSVRYFSWLRQVILNSLSKKSS